MRFVFALLFASAWAVLPQTVVQDITTVSPSAICTGGLSAGDFGPNALNDYFCKDYLEGLIATGQGIVITIVVTRSGWYGSTWEILQFFDSAVRVGLEGFPYGSCSYEVKRFQACSTAFRACNILDVSVFESLDYCAETCNYLYPCIHVPCNGLPSFDLTNLTHCIATADMVPSTTTTTTSSDATLAAGVLALLGV